MAKKIWLYLIIISVLLNCVPTTQLEITIIEQPVGGRNVTGLTCILKVILLTTHLQTPNLLNGGGQIQRERTAISGKLKATISLQMHQSR